jgi:hypothetical protein
MLGHLRDCSCAWLTSCQHTNKACWLVPLRLAHAGPSVYAECAWCAAACLIFRRGHAGLCFVQLSDSVAGHAVPYVPGCLCTQIVGDGFCEDVALRRRALDIAFTAMMREAADHERSRARLNKLPSSGANSGAAAAAAAAAASGAIVVAGHHHAAGAGTGAGSEAAGKGRLRAGW